MKYKIAKAYLEVNGESIPVGVVLGEEDKPDSPITTEYASLSEYKEGVKDARYSKEQHISDMTYHVVGTFMNNIATAPVKQKWIDELQNLGYNTSKLINKKG